MCMKMESPEAVKRQRIDSHGASVRIPQQSQDAPHGHHYSSPQQLHPPYVYNQPVPPPPYGSNQSPHPGHAPHSQPPPPHPDQQQQHLTNGYDPHGGYGPPPSQDRPPSDTNPLHGMGNPSVSQAPEDRSAPPLQPLQTSFQNGQPYPPHPPIMHGTPPTTYPQGPPPTAGPPYHPMQPPQHYEHGPPPQNGPPYADPHAGPYSAGPYGHPPPWARTPYPTQQQIPPKKGSRATQACETCRSRKAKCDEGKPSCSYCKEMRATCVYKEMQPAKADRAQKEIMDQLKKSDENYENLRGYFETLDQKFDKVEQYLGTLEKMSAFIDSLKKRTNSSPHSQTVKAEYTIPPPSGHTLESPVISRHPLSGGSPAATEHSSDPQVKKEYQQPESHKPKHAVMAHRLLGWKHIVKLLDNRPPEHDYVMACEERKGQLRLFGKGQGKDGEDSTFGGSPASASGSNNEDMCFIPRKAASQDSFWGEPTLGLPNIVNGKFFQNEEHHLGGLTRNGNLQLDKITMQTCLDSYLTNIHVLHPFLSAPHLKRMVEKVWMDYNPINKTPNGSPHVSGVHSTSNNKRKFSIDRPEDDINGSPSVNGVSEPEPYLPRRIQTAIVLLVMALGKNCSYKDPLPGFAPETLEMSSYSSQSFSPATNLSSPLTPSHLRGITGSKRGTANGINNPQGFRKGDRNVDVVPGLAYFARASDIIGPAQGNELQHAQAYLLAALYMAQLGCVLESWTWIGHACRACCFLVRDPLFRGVRNKQRVDLIRFVYLACLQLESDILAEFELRPSGLQDIDPLGYIGVPAGVVDEPDKVPEAKKPNDIMVYYNFQLSLRKMMNEWQISLYPAHEKKQDGFEEAKNHKQENYSLEIRNLCEQSLSNLRTVIQLRPELAWDENDPPATHINAARLRGKYYGAKYFIHRPLLRHALERFKASDLSPNVMEIYNNYKATPEALTSMVSPPEYVSERDWFNSQILMSCFQCVEAAKRSTCAFDGVLKEKRLMVTNLFGTAHAQFGNMLVLSAVRASTLLDFLIDEEDWKQLMDRTINFLYSLAPISTTLRQDCEILVAIRQKLDGGFKIGETDISMSFNSMP